MYFGFRGIPTRRPWARQTYNSNQVSRVIWFETREIGAKCRTWPSSYFELVSKRNVGFALLTNDKSCAQAVSFFFRKRSFLVLQCLRQIHETAVLLRCVRKRITFTDAEDIAWECYLPATSSNFGFRFWKTCLSAFKFQKAFNSNQSQVISTNLPALTRIKLSPHNSKFISMRV